MAPQSLRASDTGLDPEFEIIDISVTGAAAEDICLAAVSRLGAVHGVPRSITRLARIRTYLVRTTPVPPPLKMLLILSSPLSDGDASDELMFDLYEEKRAMLEDLAPLAQRGLIEIDVEDRPTLANLRTRMARER